MVSATIPEASQGQYQAIPERNVFGLRPATAQPGLTNPPAPLPKILLTGITTILGNKRALMKVLPAGPKPGEATKELSLILTEGQREGEVEVLQIDEREGMVKVNNSGTVMTLTFEKDGSKLPASSAPQGMPPVPGFVPGAPNPLPINGRRFPTRNFGAPGYGAAAGAPPGGMPIQPGLNSLPAQHPSLADQQLSAEEQAIVNAFERQENGGAPGLPPLPTPFAPNGSQAAPSGPTGLGASAPGSSTPVLVPQ